MPFLLRFETRKDFVVDSIFQMKLTHFSILLFAFGRKNLRLPFCAMKSTGRGSLQGLKFLPNWKIGPSTGR